MARGSLIGCKAGNYVITERIGAGGMATVYRAEHPGLGRHVALKVLRPHLALEAKVARRFELEAQAAARMHHPNIIEIYDQGRLEYDVPYYTMELLDGADMGRAMRGKPPLSPEQALPHVRQICAALAVAHEAGVVHRDLKPANVFVVQGPELSLKLLDFGIAKMLELDEAAGLTTTGLILGSSAWASPEQLAAQRDKISARTDLYSLGALIYWMLGGAAPFDGREVVPPSGIRQRPLPPPLRGVPEGVIELVQRCLAVAPEERPASADEVARAFADSLDASLEDELARLDEELAEIRRGVHPQDEEPAADAREDDATVDPRPERTDFSIPLLEPQAPPQEGDTQGSTQSTVIPLPPPMSRPQDRPPTKAALAPPLRPVVNPILEPARPPVDHRRTEVNPTLEQTGPPADTRPTEVNPTLEQTGPPDDASQMQASATEFLDPAALEAEQEEEPDDTSPTRIYQRTLEDPDG